MQFLRKIQLCKREKKVAWKEEHTYSNDNAQHNISSTQGIVSLSELLHTTTTAATTAKIVCSFQENFFQLFMICWNSQLNYIIWIPHEQDLGILPSGNESKRTIWMERMNKK